MTVRSESANEVTPGVYKALAVWKGFSLGRRFHKAAVSTMPPPSAVQFALTYGDIEGGLNASYR